MSRVSNEAGDADITKFEDPTEFVSPPLKKPKTDPEAKAEAKAEADAETQPEIRILRKGDWNDPEYTRQRDIFEEQFEKSEGYDVDWDNLYFNFPALKFEWAAHLYGRHSNKELSNTELLHLLIETAINEENEETGTNLKFVKYVSANILGVQGFLFYITFWAVDLSSPNPEPKCYQTKVRTFMDEIHVIEIQVKANTTMINGDW